MSHIRKIGKNYAIDFYWNEKPAQKTLRQRLIHFI
jgi:hypothetical protein